jgi:hypothetical protein
MRTLRVANEESTIETTTQDEQPKIASVTGETISSISPESEV